MPTFFWASLGGILIWAGFGWMRRVVVGCGCGWGYDVGGWFCVVVFEEFSFSFGKAWQCGVAVPKGVTRKKREFLTLSRPSQTTSPKTDPSAKSKKQSKTQRSEAGSRNLKKSRKNQKTPKNTRNKTLNQDFHAWLWLGFRQSIYRNLIFHRLLMVQPVECSLLNRN